MTQAGRYKSVAPLLRKDGRELSWVNKPQRDFSDKAEETTSDGGGCTCRSSGSLEWSVVVWALIRFVRRRPTQLLNEAG